MPASLMADMMLAAAWGKEEASMTSLLGSFFDTAGQRGVKAEASILQHLQFR